jgi:hypothetical protein
MVRTTKFQQIGNALHKAVQRSVIEWQDSETSLKMGSISAETLDFTKEQN